MFSSDPKPSRTCIGVANLPAGTDVEITCTSPPSPLSFDSTCRKASRSSQVSLLFSQYRYRTSANWISREGHLSSFAFVSLSIRELSCVLTSSSLFGFSTRRAPSLLPLLLSSLLLSLLPTSSSSLGAVESRMASSSREPFRIEPSSLSLTSELCLERSDWDWRMVSYFSFSYLEEYRCEKRAPAKSRKWS